MKNDEQVNYKSVDFINLDNYINKTCTERAIILNS